MFDSIRLHTHNQNLSRTGNSHDDFVFVIFEPWKSTELYVLIMLIKTPYCSAKIFIMVSRDCDCWAKHQNLTREKFNE